MRTAVFAVILLLFQTVRAIFDNVCASAHSTTVSNDFLDHANYLTITYFSSTTLTGTGGVHVLDLAIPLVF